MEETGNIKETC